MTLPDYLIYKKTSKNGELQIRKVSKQAGISVTTNNYDFPFSTTVEYFIGEQEAKDIIKALKEYFHI